MRKGDFDNAPYSVEKAGRLFSGMEQACVIASIRPIRSKRWHVTTDCREVDEIFQQSFILDTPSRELFRIEGDEYLWCLGVDDEGIAVMPSAVAKPPAAVDLRSMSNSQLVSYWDQQNTGCRGGHGDDPETDRACERRNDAVDALEKRNLCYKSSKGRMDWVRCR